MHGDLAIPRPTKIDQAATGSGGFRSTGTSGASPGQSRTLTFRDTEFESRPGFEISARAVDIYFRSFNAARSFAKCIQSLVNQIEQHPYP
jgi:hypothetical protein